MLENRDVQIFRGFESQKLGRLAGMGFSSVISQAFRGNFRDYFKRLFSEGNFLFLRLCLRPLVFFTLATASCVSSVNRTYALLARNGLPPRQFLNVVLKYKTVVGGKKRHIPHAKMP